MDIKEIIDNLENPQGTVQERLERLQRDFHSRNVCILLALDKDFTFEEAKKDCVEILEKIGAYVLNGHSTKGLEEYFGIDGVTVI